MRNYLRNSSIVAFAAMCAIVNAQNIDTQCGAIRSCTKANIGSKEMLYVAEEEGNISLNDLTGKQRWCKTPDEQAVIFEIQAKDITGDNNDDVVAASGNGSVYAWDSNGKLLWKYSTPKKTRLSEVAIVGKGKSARIFAGGNDMTIYELDSNGKELSKTPVKGCIRFITNGFFTDSNKESLFVLTYKSDKYGSEFAGFINPDTKEVISSDKIDRLVPRGNQIRDIDVSDVNGDKKDEVILFAAEKTCVAVAFDSNFKKVFLFKGGKDSQRYASVQGVSLNPYKNEIVMQFGGVMYLIDNKGKLIERAGAPHEGILYNDLVWLSGAKKMLGAGQIGGDNTFYEYNVAKSGWMATEHNFGGLYKEVENNLNTLYSQCKNFKAPAYQLKQNDPFVVLGLDKAKQGIKDLKGIRNVIFVEGSKTFSDNSDRSELVEKIGKRALLIDKRRTYNNSPEEIVSWAAEQEANHKPFQLWVGHGTDPFIVQIATLEKIIKAAPTTCYGFIYAEMADADDPRNIYFAKEYIPRLSKAIHDNKAVTKIYFRYKNMFWGANSHIKVWKDVFFSNKYSDILVPSAEDTSNRLQDINFSGRVGMFMSGYVDNFAIRLVDDNPTSWRPLSPGGQRSFSLYLRTAALLSMYGSNHGVFFPIKYIGDGEYNKFFALVESGVLPSVKREDILSVGSWHLIKDVDDKYIASVENHHDITLYKDTDADPVFSVLAGQWSGASVPEHDYSRVSLGVKYRWLSFLPEMPNGMVPITDYDYVSKLKPGSYVVSNIKEGYSNGKMLSGKEFGPIMSKVVTEGGNKLLMKVSGASWGLIKIDSKHARLALIDPGYISPAERNVTITLQNQRPVSATDILSKEKIDVSNNTITLKVPAGSMRFIDFEYSSDI